MKQPLPVWLFVSYGGGHVKALLPVAQRVKAMGLARPVYLGLTTAASIVRAAGIEVLGFRDVLTPADEAARQKGEALVAQLQVQAADREESVAYLGLSYQDMADRLGAEAAAQAYARFGRQSFLPLGVLKRVISQVKPSLVIATNSPRAEQAAILTARAMGVPSACLLDLLGIWERELLARADYADALCVLNESVRDAFVAAGRPAEQVHVTGNPAFDSLLDPALRREGESIRRDTGWERLHVCLFASSPEPLEIPNVQGRGDPDWPRRIERELIAAVERNPRMALFVRRHPSDPPAHEVAAMAHPRIRVSGSDMPLHGAIHAADEVIVTVSTVGVEAALAGKAVTQIRGSILDHLSPYVELGIANRAVRLEDIAEAFAPGARMLARADAQAGGPILAPATDRVIDVLRRLQERANG